jgi:hypothetical protein
LSKFISYFGNWKKKIRSVKQIKTGREGRGEFFKFSN